MNRTGKETKKSWLWKAVGGVLALALAGGLTFIYVVLPEKVAQSIVAKAQIRKPLVQNPETYSLVSQDVSFVTEDGITLSGWWLPAPSGKKPTGTALLSHGVFKNREQVLTRAAMMVKLGYQVLLFDHRGNGLSGDSPVSGGLLESRDYHAALRFLKTRDRLKKPVILFGFSMGAMSAIRAAADSTEVDGIIADSPLANLKSYVSRRTIGGSFSSLPGFLNRCLAAYDRLTGLSLNEGDLDLMPVVAKLHELPVLYITGEGDDLARSEEVRKLFAKTASHHRRLVYVPDAGHEETFDKFPIIYRKAVTEFLIALKRGPAPATDYSTHPIK
jgi:uncharacterized protein